MVALPSSRPPGWPLICLLAIECQVWEVEWGRDGFKGVQRAMDLKGHSRKVRVRMCAFARLHMNVGVCSVCAHVWVRVHAFVQ
jgi:hypothetical protein